MKPQMNRKYPILQDIGTQLESFPLSKYVFFYDDGQVYRAFVCDKINVTERIVEAFRNDSMIVSIPSETTWRMVRKDNLEFILGSEMEEVEYHNMKLKKDLNKRMMKELDLEDEQPKIQHEYVQGFNPKLYN